MQNSGGIVNLDVARPQGREAGYLHPAVVVTAQRILDAAPTVIQVVPLTSTLRGFRTEVVIEPDPTNGLGQSSAAQCQHARAVSPARVVRTVGNIGPLALTQIRETIAVIIDLPRALGLLTSTFSRSSSALVITTFQPDHAPPVMRFAPNVGWIVGRGPPSGSGGFRPNPQIAYGKNR